MESKRFFFFFLVFPIYFLLAHKEGNPSKEHQKDLHPFQFLNIIEEIPTVETKVPDEVPIYLRNVSKWIISGNLAGFMNFHQIRSVSIPIQLNIIPIGFEGDGNKGLRVGMHELKGYLEHTLHRLPHTIAPVGEHQTTIDKFITPSTSVDYKIFVQVVKLCPLVNTLIEDHIYWNLRPELPDEGVEVSHKQHSSGEKYQVDVFHFSAMLGSLIKYMNMSQQYTLFILNPNSPLTKDQVYGYRSGFSDEELSFLYKNDALSSILAPLENVQLNSENNPTQKRQTEKGKRSLVSTDIQYEELIHESEEWAKWYINTQKKGQMPQGLNGSCNSQLEDDPKCLFNRPQTQRTNVMQMISQIVSSGNPSMKSYLYSAYKNNNMFEEALVDLWISHNRFTFLDLTAGPFEWGPLIAAEGARTKKSIPRFISTSLNVEEELPMKGFGNIPDSQSRYEAFKAEETILLRYWATECEAKRNDTEFCKELKIRIDNLYNGDFAGEDLHPILEGSQDEVLDISRSLDQFLLSLSNFVSITLQQVLLPSSGLYSTPYTQRVIFHFFLITNHKDYKPRDPGYFNYNLFKHEMEKLALPNQQFSFSLREISLESEGSLGNGYSSSLRSCVLPRLSVKGEFSTESIIYIDAKQLQYYLKLLNTDRHDDEEEYEKIRITRHIPIFFFSVNYPIPVLIDKYYQAKALNDMVIVVQSNISKWESRINWNKNPVYYDLRNPIKPALASTALLLGGLVPMHISYNDATKSAIQNWLWSVGDNPLSYTSYGYHFTDIQKDIIFRNYIVNSLNSSIETVNKAVGLLLQQKTTEYNAKAIGFLNLDEMGQIYETIKNLWIEISLATYNLEYIVATKKLEELEFAVKEYYTQAVDVVDSLGVFKCIELEGLTTNTYSFLSWLVPLAVAIDLLIVVFYLFISSQQKPKLKIN